MSALFSINFRREAYLKEIAKARRRVFAIGVWVAYFGVFAVVLGLYGLNCASLSRRAGLVERQTARMKGTQEAGAGWTFSSAELAQMESYALNPRQWRDRLTRLSELLPANARITTLEINPSNLSTRPGREKLVITGYLRPERDEDRMQAVMEIVQTLHADSLFSRSYRNIRLASTRALEGPQPTAEFQIECQ